MQLDYENIFSHDQAITGDAVSTNVIDLSQNRNVGIGHPLGLLIQVTEDFATLTSLTVTVQTADNEAFDEGEEDLVSTNIPVADLVAGKRLPLNTAPRGVKRFVRLDYDVTGSNATAGAITAGLLLDQSDFHAYPANT